MDVGGVLTERCKWGKLYDQKFDRVVFVVALDWSELLPSCPVWLTSFFRVVQLLPVAGRESCCEPHARRPRSLWVKYAPALCSLRLNSALVAVCQDPKLRAVPKLLILNKVDSFRLRLGSDFEQFLRCFPE